MWSTLFADAFFFHPSLTGHLEEAGGGGNGDGSGGGLYVLRDGADAHPSATDDYEWLLAPPAALGPLELRRGAAFRARRIATRR